MNTRKFRHWDNKLIFQSLQKALLIKARIEKTCYENQVNPEQLPMSMMPSDVLYDMVACYEAMYDKLLEEELIVSGFPKSPPTYH